MFNSVKFSLLFILFSLSGCSGPWDEAVFPIEAYRAGFLLKDKIQIRRGDAYTFFLAFNCADCPSNRARADEYFNLLQWKVGSNNSASIPVRMKVSKEGRVYLDGIYNVNYFPASIFIHAPDKIQVSIGRIGGAKLEPGVYDFELEVLKDDSRLEKYRSFLLMQYFNPKV